MLKISNLTLTNFRNFLSKKLEFYSSLVLLSGANGVGKTNILEALTILGRNSSLRGSSFEDMLFSDQISQEKKQEFVIYAQISSHEFIEKIAVSFNAQGKKKSLYINDEPFNNKRQGDVKNNLINFIYLTPQLEQLFILGKSQRRDYLDKIVSDIDFEHVSRINSYQKLLKERLTILQKYRNQTSSAKWLDVVEGNIVELGVAIASARLEAVDFFNKAISSFSSNFPRPKLHAIGDIEQLFGNQSAVKLEEFYREKLAQSRNLDLASFRTDFGVHRSDFDVIFSDKNASALRSSTGEQKAIMMGITLARAKISANYKNQPTILIFDEVVSHLDEKRKSDLFDEIKFANLQSFFSATSADLIPKEYLEKLQIINL